MELHGTCHNHGTFGDYSPIVVHVHKHVCITDMFMWDTIITLLYHCSTLGVFNDRA
jgi:hypothetical protein